MAHRTATLASAFALESAWDSWTKLEDHDPLSQLHFKYWGKKIEEETRELQPTIDRTNDIGPQSYGLNLDIKLRNSRLLVRQDYIRIYDYCKQREECPAGVEWMPRSVVITGHPGVGALLCLVGSCAPLITPRVKR